MVFKDSAAAEVVADLSPENSIAMVAVNFCRHSSAMWCPAMQLKTLLGVIDHQRKSTMYSCEQRHLARNLDILAKRVPGPEGASSRREAPSLGTLRLP